MSPLPGNPFLPDPEKSDTADGRNITYATLALAFEQRTANLIARREQLLNVGLDYMATDLAGEIDDRLGLNGDTK